jgi:uncharacterized protein YegP (UPF0339 family)
MRFRANTPADICDILIPSQRPKGDFTVKYVMYKDTANQWRWRLVAANEKIVANSGEGYFNKADCRGAIELVKSSSSAPVMEAAGS